MAISPLVLGIIGAGLLFLLKNKSDDSGTTTPLGPPGPPGPAPPTSALLIPRDDGTIGIQEDAAIAYLRTLKNWAVMTEGPMLGARGATIIADLDLKSVPLDRVAQVWALNHGKTQSVLAEISQIGPSRHRPHRLLVVPRGTEKQFAAPGGHWAVLIGSFADWFSLSRKLGVLMSDVSEITPTGAPPAAP